MINNIITGEKPRFSIYNETKNSYFGVIVYLMLNFITNKTIKPIGPIKPKEPKQTRKHSKRISARQVQENLDKFIHEQRQVNSILLEFVKEQREFNKIILKRIDNLEKRIDNLEKRIDNLVIVNSLQEHQ